MNPYIYPDDSIYPAVKNHKFHSNGMVHGAFKFGAAGIPSSLPVAAGCRPRNWSFHKAWDSFQQVGWSCLIAVTVLPVLWQIFRNGDGSRLSSGVCLYFLHLHCQESWFTGISHIKSICRGPISIVSCFQSSIYSWSSSMRELKNLLLSLCYRLLYSYWGYFDQCQNSDYQ